MEAFRTVLHDGTRQPTWKRPMRARKAKRGSKAARSSRRPEDEACKAAIADICYQHARKLYKYPGAPTFPANDALGFWRRARNGDVVSWTDRAVQHGGPVMKDPR